MTLLARLGTIKWQLTAVSRTPTASDWRHPHARCFPETVASDYFSLFNLDGDLIADMSFLRIEDMEPVRIPYRFTDLPDDLIGWCVVVDPDDRVIEICEDNNELAFP